MNRKQALMLGGMPTKHERTPIHSSAAYGFGWELGHVTRGNEPATYDAVRLADNATVKGATWENAVKFVCPSGGDPRSVTYPAGCYSA